MKKFFQKIWNWIKSLFFDKRIKYTDDVENDKPMLTLNPQCPVCKQTVMGYFVTGVVEVKYEWFTGGIRTHLSGHGSQEYQFHYYKCGKCGHWEMYEYRETPSWWDDLWGNDCPFTRGDIIKKWQNNEFRMKEYEGHTITKW